MNPLLLQTPTDSPAINQIQSVVNTMASDAFPRIFLYLCLVIVVIIIVIMLIFKIFEKLLSKTEYIKLGFLTFKNKKEQNTQTTQIDKHEVDINFFIRILDVIMNTELAKFSTDIITATKDIRKIEDTYDDQSHNIFSKILNNIKTEYHDRLLVVAIDVTGFDLVRIKNTREYFFILDLLRDFEIEWLKDSKEITRRNGFVEFLNDKHRSKDYIEELQESIFQCVDSKKLDMTDIKRCDLERALKTANEEMYCSLEKMFTTLASLKKTMLLKREAKLNYIDDVVKNSATNIITTITTKIVKNIHVSNITSLNNKQDINLKKDGIDKDDCQLKLDEKL